MNIIGLPGYTPPPSHDPEFIDFADAYLDLGHTITPETYPAALMQTVGRVFIETEMPPVSMIANLEGSSRHYYTNSVQPNLIRQAKDPALAPKIFNLTSKLGAYIGSAIKKGNIAQVQGIKFSESAIDVDGSRAPFDVQTGHVVDYGMGLNGLLGHMHNVKAERYKVLAIQHSVHEQNILYGISDELALSNVNISAAGISKGTESLLQAGLGGQIDMVIASRIHMAGTELLKGTRLSSQLLRAGGLLVARGPRKFPQGADYEAVARIVKKDPTYEIIVDSNTNRRTPGHTVESNKLIIAQKK